MILKKKHPVEIHTIGDYSGEDFDTVPKITSVTTLGVTVYVLHDSKGRHVATCSSPKPLSTHAFNCGAAHLRHAYDLRAAEMIDTAQA